MIEESVKVLTGTSFWCIEMVSGIGDGGGGGGSGSGSDSDNCDNQQQSKCVRMEFEIGRMKGNNSNKDDDNKLR